MGSRLWSALLPVAFCGAILGTVLLSPSARLPIKTPFVDKAERGRPLLVPMMNTGAQSGFSTSRAYLFTATPGALLRHPEIQLFFATAADGKRRLQAELHVMGTPCRYRTREGALLSDGQALAFERDQACTESALAPTGQFMLTVEREGPADLALWAFAPRVDLPAREAIRVSPSPEPTAPLLRGQFVDYPPTAPRIGLLNYMWQVSASTAWLWLLLGVAAALVAAGGVLFPMWPFPLQTERVPFKQTLRGGLGAACFAGALGLAYAVLAPPLSGPDEPYHLAGFGELNGENRLAASTLEWMKLTHFTRIRARPFEHFRAMDIGQPLDLPDPEFRATEVEMRSASVALLWRLAGHALHDQGAPRTLLAVRILNASVFAVMVGLGTGLALWCSAAPYPQLLCLPFLFVPTLPFFAMHFSETALLTSAEVLVASSLGVMFLGGPRAHWVGFPLGLGTALMLAGGRSPWPLAVVVTSVLGARILLGPGPSAGQGRPTAVYWVGFGIGSMAFYLLLNEPYRAMLLRFAAFAPAGPRPATTWLLDHPWGLTGLVALGGVTELCLGPLRLRLGEACKGPAGAAVRWAGFAVAGLIILSLAGSLFLPYPQLALEPSQPLARSEFLTDILATTATMFRLRDPNFLLFSTFWVGFGWLDTMPDSVFLTSLTLLSGASLIGLLVYLARHRDTRRFVWLCSFGLGSTLALVMYALSIYGLPMALQGRYLIGWYLPIVVVIGCSVVLADPIRGEQGWYAILGRIPRPGPLLALTALIHTYCLCFLLDRYF